MTDLKFEDCLSRLEQIVATLEAGNLSLEDSLKIFEEGIAMSRHCARYLEDAQRRIELRSSRRLRSSRGRAGRLGRRRRRSRRCWSATGCQSQGAGAPGNLAQECSS